MLDKAFTAVKADNAFTASLGVVNSDGRTFWPRTFWPGRFGQDVLATDVLATYIEKTDVLAKSIIYVLIIDIKATNIFNLQTIFNKYNCVEGLVVHYKNIK